MMIIIIIHSLEMIKYKFFSEREHFNINLWYFFKPFFSLYLVGFRHFFLMIHRHVEKMDKNLRFFISNNPM